jgi:SEC-C motif-containing protein
MRSRYSAYAMSRPEYIQRTTHPKSPYFEFDSKKWGAAILQFCQSTEFIRLEILGYGEDWVHFSAHMKQAGKSLTLTEMSRFERLDSNWRYVDGVIEK